MTCTCNVYDCLLERQHSQVCMDAAFEAAKHVYSQLGWGFSEACLRSALAFELSFVFHTVEEERVLPVTYTASNGKSKALPHAFVKADIVVLDQSLTHTEYILLELKVQRGTGTAKLDSAQSQVFGYAKMLAAQLQKGVHVHAAVAIFTDNGLNFRTYVTLEATGENGWSIVSDLPSVHQHKRSALTTATKNTPVV